MTHPSRDAVSGPADAPEPASLVGVLEYIAGQEHVDDGLAALLRSTVANLEEQQPPGLPFLSVLLRTQGKRIEPLKDALLCLAAQTDDDFEVIVLDHDSEPQAAEAVRRAVEQHPTRFSARVRIIEVSGGSRARPLNVGVEAARGSYIAVFDDDDLVLANWVEAFHTAAREARGRLLRSVAATQKVSAARWPSGQDGFRTSSWPDAEYAKTFSAFDHLRVNHTPFMSLAFPANLFSKLGYRFDEELVVCEDWDMIIRASFICGVKDVSELTSVYRRWQLGSSSYTDHDSAAWRQSEAKVIANVDRRPIIFPPGSVSQSRQLLEDENANIRLVHLLASRAWRYARPIRGALRVAAYARRGAARIRRRS